jgi:protein-S-isoprenylcysteine O-methyltransferase Ste14
MLAQHFAEHRIAWSRVLIAGTLVLVVFGTPPRTVLGWVAELMELAGFALLIAAALWRIWCHLFIAGSKNGELAITGPYSVVRNPLYLGNLIGALGFGLAVERPYLVALFALAFVVLYPTVVAREEARLGELFGERFREYCARVPRWLPCWSLYREPASISVSPRYARKAILDAMWFLWAFGLWEFIEQLHEYHLIPNLF